MLSAVDIVLPTSFEDLCSRFLIAYRLVLLCGYSDLKNKKLHREFDRLYRNSDLSKQRYIGYENSLRGLRGYHLANCRCDRSSFRRYEKA